jgi:NAD(P)-dependent dehydrogenase (short-subunit alcohol dehydrogenase family)
MAQRTWLITGISSGFGRHLAEQLLAAGSRVAEFRFDSLKLAEPMTEYDQTPAAMVRGAKDRSHPSAGDPAKMAAAIIASADIEPAPLRLVLGSDSYRFITTALTARLADVQAQAQTAPATDWADD